ncbi:MucBP domain-containing protein [Fructilactobacillus hinvesii]|uniref:MucBP domain-containing protein n=1 Tax=Fructilactobacillus hinvesii TaxID=2940300 RepID=A0ABY5BUX4_9LACO|nr:MucBP domain-containing protein [Fructilactobacillus hinvesii]USS87463.1 MucBP domain-containing protein [Fructilactobacillus hinvesii]
MGPRQRVTASQTIIVHYQDTDGKAIEGLSDKQITGEVGDPYVIDTPDDVPGYKYQKSTIPLQGTFTADQSAVVTYQKNQ